MSTTNVAAASAAAGSTATSTMSKSKKLGQILKLASVRGAKSKSMKHKYSTGQLQSHSFISVTTDANCHVCHKSMNNKKALHCKRKCIRIVLHLSFCIVSNEIPNVSEIEFFMIFVKTIHDLKETEKIHLLLILYFT